ncbi:MAG: leucine--tRNA ligase [Promethearchaeota archaeon]
MVEYDFKKIEKKWQQRWEKDKVFEVEMAPKKKKYYVLEMYPYPSGKLHMGHLRNYTIGDSYARFMRMCGYNVLYPMGYDSFGLPAENAAIDHGANPEEWTNKNIKTMKNQQKSIGLSYDWRRELCSHDPNYYKWDQWFFLKMFEKGLAYRQESYVNWCNKCATVLANEQSQGGRCWRCNSIVDQKFLSQWFLKIRNYAEELLEGLEVVEWPEKVKIMQRNWIGRSEGSIIKFPIVDEDRTVDIFTTRPDTLYGVTFMIYAVEHPDVAKWVEGTEYEANYRELYNEVMKQDKFERTNVDVEKKGMFIGKYCMNPITKEEIPIYCANFVIYEYGAGAVMAVPAHDQRDFEMARAYDIPIKVVIQPHDYELNAEKMTRAYEADGILSNSDEFNGMENRSAIDAITEKLENIDMGYATINYKLRDWGISRQRYWGCPIPIIICEDCGDVAVPYKDLPVLLPEDVKFDSGGNPLETSDSFIHVKCPKCNKNAKRVTDTMDTFVDSSWYFWAFTSKDHEKEPYTKKEVNYWGNVDQYIGGIEHAVMHLIYARFWTKVTRDLGLHKHDEPFQRLLTQGMINKAHPFCEKCNAFLMKADLEEMKCKKCGNTDLILKSVKMSKSYGNTIDPTEIIDSYGADAARFFILFGASPESGLEWSDEGVGFANRFINNTFQLLAEPPENIRQEKTIRDMLIQYNLHKTIKKTSESLEKIAIRDAVNQIIQFTSELAKYKQEGVKEEVFNECKEKITLLLHPIAPHMTEEIWEKMKNKGYLSLASWPDYDESFLTEENHFKWKMMNNIFESINNIKSIIKRDKLEEIKIIIADQWKYDFNAILIPLVSEQKNHGEIMKEIMRNAAFKPHGKFIGQTITRVLKNIGKFPNITLSANDELAFFTDIKSIIEKKYNSKVRIILEKKSKEQKASQAYPGRPAIVIN